MEKDVIWLEFLSPWTFTPSVLPSKGDKRGEAGKRQRGKKNGLKRSDLTQVYWIHAWSRPPSGSGSDVWPLGLISQTREEKKVVELSRPQLLISGENIWALQPRVASNRKEEIWSHFGVKCTRGKWIHPKIAFTIIAKPNRGKSFAISLQQK